MGLRRLQCGLVLALGPVCVWGQTPVISAGGVLNVASYSYQGLPNGDIAQGCLFTVFLDSTLPVPNQLLNSYPVPKSFNNVSMQVTVGGTSVDALMFGTSPKQVSAILPSATPLGAATITVTYNEQTSAPAPFNVVASSFGWFTRNQAGSGPGSFTDLNYFPLTPTNAASPGDYVIGWGTGLGAVSGDEAAGGLPGAINPPGLAMFVGNVQVTPLFTGRSASAGEDQINFQIPAGITGCAVPVVIQIGGVVSNAATIPIASPGRVCSDVNGFSISDLQTLKSNGSLSTGVVSLDRSSFTVLTLPGLPPITSSNDTGTATFTKVDSTTIISSLGPFFEQSSVGTCLVFIFKGGTTSVIDPTLSTPLDAGALIDVNGPAGAAQLTEVSTGLYSATLGGIGGQPTYLNPGAYPVDNGSGGTDVHSFNAALNLVAGATWANQASIATVVRSQGVTVTWTGGDPKGYAIIEGFSGITSPTVGASFRCTAPIGAGQFTVPPYVLLALPPNSGGPASSLSVGSSTLPVRFTASGLDAGYLSSSAVTAQSIVFQ